MVLARKGYDQTLTLAGLRVSVRKVRTSDRNNVERGGMDGRRFDDLARSLASGAATRRRLLTGAVAAVVGAVTGGRLQPGEAQTACPPGQVRRAGLGCVCRTTGRP